MRSHNTLLLRDIGLCASAQFSIDDWKLPPWYFNSHHWATAISATDNIGILISSKLFVHGFDLPVALVGVTTLSGSKTDGVFVALRLRYALQSN